MAEHRFHGLSVREILALKKGGVLSAPRPPGSPDWGDVLDMTWSEVDAAASAGVPGLRTMRKLLSDRRFDR